MEALLEILRELHPETDFETETALVDHGVLVSFDIVMLITRIEEEFDVVIPAKDITPGRPPPVSGRPDPGSRR